MQRTLRFAPVQHLILRDIRAIRPLDPQRTQDDYTEITGADLSAREERAARGTWLVTERPEFRDVYGTSSLRRVAYLPQWRTMDPTIPRDTAGAAHAVLEVCRALGLAAPMTPAILAWRLFRRFVIRTIFPLPRPVAELAIQRRPGYFIFAAEQSGMKRHVYRYDLNQSYASWLRWWPDLGDGAWYPSRAISDHGIYHVRSGFSGTVLTGQEIAELSGIDQGRFEILGGWAWSGDGGGRPSPFWQFTQFCSAYAGPLRKLLRRCPVMVTGKFAAGYRPDRSTWYASGTAYPIIYASVVASLWQAMVRTARFAGSDLLYGYVDGLHTRTPFPNHWLRDEPGAWKLQGTDPEDVEYRRGVGHWRTAGEWKHQGVSR